LADICLYIEERGSKLDDFGGLSWFKTEVVISVANGKWRGEMSFLLKYQRLFLISNKQNANVGEIRMDNGWNLVRRRRFLIGRNNYFLAYLRNLMVL